MRARPNEVIGIGIATIVGVCCWGALALVYYAVKVVV